VNFHEIRWIGDLQTSEELFEFWKWFWIPVGCCCATRLQLLGFMATVLSCGSTVQQYLPYCAHLLLANNNTINFTVEWCRCALYHIPCVYRLLNFAGCLCVNLAKMADRIDMSYCWLGGSKTHMRPRNHVLDGVHTGNTWQIQLNNLCLVTNGDCGLSLLLDKEPVNLVANCE